MTRPEPWQPLTITVSERVPENWLGFYDPDHSEIVIADDLDERERRLTLFHEICHYLYGDCGIDDDGHSAPGCDAVAEAFAEATVNLLEALRPITEPKDSNALAARARVDQPEGTASTLSSVEPL